MEEYILLGFRDGSSVYMTKTDCTIDEFCDLTPSDHFPVKTFCLTETSEGTEMFTLTNFVGQGRKWSLLGLV